jgi:hypothetical protein
VPDTFILGILGMDEGGRKVEGEEEEGGVIRELEKKKRKDMKRLKGVKGKRRIVGATIF